MNFNSVFEELNKLYEENNAKETEPKLAEGEAEGKQETSQESTTAATEEGAKESLKEAADDEIEFAEDPVDGLPEEDHEEAPIEEEIPEEDVNTVEEFLKSFSEYDGKLKLEFKPIVIDDKEYQVTGLLSDDTEEGKLVVEVVVDMPEAEAATAEEEPVEDVPVDEE